MARKSGPLTIGEESSRIDKRFKSGRVDAQQWAKSGVWVMVRSSNVKGIKYDYRGKRLFVQFKSSGIYEYVSVRPTVAKEMFNASSMGKFVHQRLKGEYLYRKIG